MLVYQITNQESRGPIWAASILKCECNNCRKAKVGKPPGDGSARHSFWQRTKVRDSTGGKRLRERDRFFRQREEVSRARDRISFERNRIFRLYGMEKRKRSRWRISSSG
jgi:hypothetical protein